MLAFILSLGPIQLVASRIDCVGVLQAGATDAQGYRASFRAPGHHGHLDGQVELEQPLPSTLDNHLVDFQFSATLTISVALAVPRTSVS